MRVASPPFLPVKALALPELTTSARARPCSRLSRHHSTGAEQVLERVSTPAAAVPGSITATIKSVRPWYRIPASQAARRTPSRPGSTGSPVGAKGDGLAAILAMTPPLRQAIGPPPLLLRQGRHPIAFDRLPNVRIDVLDLGLAAQFAGDLLRLLMDHRGPHTILDILEVGRASLSPFVDLDDMPAELGLEGLPNLSRLQFEGGLLELRHHLAAREKAEFAALVLRAGILGVLPSERGKIAAMQDFFEQFSGLVLAFNQYVPRANLILGLQGANLLVVIPFGLRVGDRLLDALVKVDVA